MRWLQNRFGKQRDSLLFKPSDQREQWTKWPKHLTAPTKQDMNYLDRLDPPIGRAVSPGGRIRIIRHPEFVWYYDAGHSTTFSQLLFKDGTEWRLRR